MIKTNYRKDASYINRLNKIEVLRLIRDSGEISRADIVKKTRLSAPTVTRITDNLINDKLAVMVGEGNSTGGRPPKLIRFDGTHNYVIGIDLGSTSIRGVICNLNGLFITEIETPTDLDGGFEQICIQVGELITKLIDRSKLEKEKIMGVGLAVAGLINSESGIVEYSPVFGWWKVNLKTELKKHIPENLPIFYDNVSRLTALGEMLYGVGKKFKHFICVNVGYGIGAGIIINGTPLYGSQGFTGEFGHVVLDSDSQYVGKDGIKGCLEALSSGYGMAEIAKDRLKKGDKSILTKGKSIDEVSAKDIVDAAREGDVLSTEIFDSAMHYLGLGLDTLIKLFNPEAVVISGGLTKNGDVFFDKLKHNTFKNILYPVEDRVEILPSSFKDDATLIGAFSLIISKVFQFESEELEA